MYERFTDRARKVMQLANQEAQRFNHEYIATEHILLALIKEGSGVAAQALKGLHLDLPRLHREIKKIVPPGPPDRITMGKLPQTPGAKKVIGYAIDEARDLNHNYIGTEHLLLGLLRTRDGVAAQVLTNLGLTLHRVRREVLITLGELRLPDDVLPESDQAQLARTRARLRALEDHVAQMRLYIGAFLGIAAGSLIAGPEGACPGLLAGTLLVNWRQFFLATLVGSIAGALIGSIYIGTDVASVTGAILGTLVTGCLAELGHPTARSK